MEDEEEEEEHEQEQEEIEEEEEEEEQDGSNTSYEHGGSDVGAANGIPADNDDAPKGTTVDRDIHAIAIRMLEAILDNNDDATDSSPLPSSSEEDNTQYHIPGPMCEAEASPLTEDFQSNGNVRFVQPIVDRIPQPEELAWHVDTDQFVWLTDKEAYQAKQGINALIKSGQSIDLETLTSIIGNEELATLYWLVMALKGQVMSSYIVYDSPRCYIGEEEVQGEGFVMTSPQGSFKLVDRYQFSYANFTQGKFS